jgi:hypothetical protein
LVLLDPLFHVQEADVPDWPPHPINRVSVQKSAKIISPIAAPEV